MRRFEQASSTYVVEQNKEKYVYPFKPQFFLHKIRLKDCSLHGLFNVMRTYINNHRKAFVMKQKLDMRFRKFIEIILFSFRHIADGRTKKKYFKEVKSVVISLSKLNF